VCDIIKSHDPLFFDDLKTKQELDKAPASKPIFILKPKDGTGPWYLYTIHNVSKLLRKLVCRLQGTYFYRGVMYRCGVHVDNDILYRFAECLQFFLMTRELPLPYDEYGENVRIERVPCINRSKGQEVVFFGSLDFNESYGHSTDTTAVAATTAISAAIAIAATAQADTAVTATKRLKRKCME
jgi:hypothetical protein